jgi:hypothetical protein
MPVVRVIYWPPLATTQWLDEQLRSYERAGRRRYTDAGFYRFICCAVWTAALAWLAVLVVLVVLR